MAPRIKQRFDLPRSTELGRLDAPDHFWHEDYGLCLFVEDDGGKDLAVFVYQRKVRGELISLPRSTKVQCCDVEMEFKLKPARSVD